MRVAVSQFATSSNFQENLATCVRMISEAAVCKPSLIVLPEFCNTLFFNRLPVNKPFSTVESTPVDSHDEQPCYLDHNQAWNEAVSIGGDFLQVIAEQAKVYHCYIVINVTLRRDLTRDISHDKKSGLIKSNISVTSCLFSPLGELIHQQDKQTLIGDECYFFTRVNEASKVATTRFGKLGLLMGSDSMTFDTSRHLGLSGAQLLCNSMSTFAIDQSNLHDSARACENNVFFVSANKIGPIEPLKPLNEVQANEKVSFAETTDFVIPQEYFVGIGQSQIISPEGKVLAKLNNNEEGFIFADIDFSVVETSKGAGVSNKRRPDGTDVMNQLRPALYQELTLSTNTKIKTRHNERLSMQDIKVPVTANVAIFATYKSNEEAIDDVCHYIENNLSDIIQLPELFFIADKKITQDTEQRAQIAYLSEQLINQVSAVLRPFQYLCTSIIIDEIHQAVLISKEGVFALQQQLHFCHRYQWSALGDSVNTIVLPLEQGNITVTMLTADDANVPEIVKIASLQGTHLLLVPFDIQEPSEVTYSLLSRATENRICIVAASREKSFVNDSIPESDSHNIYGKNKVKLQKSTGLIVNLTTDISLLPQWKARKFNGYINEPLVKHQFGKITKAVVHPIAACYKIIATDHYC